MGLGEVSESMAMVCIRERRIKGERSEGSRGEGGNGLICLSCDEETADGMEKPKGGSEGH